MCAMTWMTRVLSSLPLFLAGIVSQSAWGQPMIMAAPSPTEASSQATPTPTPAVEQKYDGVVPGPTGKNPLPSAPTGGGPHLVWTGFQMTSTGSRVFLQTTSAVQFDLKEGAVGKAGKSVLSVVLHDCRIHMANNRRRIDTRFFATPVAGISARHKRHDVEVQISLREAASTTPHSETGPDGTQFLVMDFPPGRPAPIPSAPTPTALEEVGDMSKELAADAERAVDQRSQAQSAAPRTHSHRHR